jgi:hypothetical protein
MEHQTGPGQAGGGPAPDDGAAMAWLQSFAGEGDDRAGEADGTSDPGPSGPPAGAQSTAAGGGTAAGGETAAGSLASAAHAAVSRAAAPVPSTGEPRVDAALRLLERLPGLPVSDHPELFEQVHARLSEVLGELEAGPGGPAGG